MDGPALYLNLNCPRQSGKTTLARQLTDNTRTYVTLDDEATYQAATDDPVSFIGQFDYATIDEVQRAPELIRRIKIAVDEDQRPGRFLLTGSANILTIPTVSESLAGRMAIETLLPLSQGEIAGRLKFSRKLLTYNFPDFMRYYIIPNMINMAKI